MGRPRTSLTVGHPFLHVEGPVANGGLAGSAGEAVYVPRHLQGVHDLLGGRPQSRGSPRPRLLPRFSPRGLPSHIMPTHSVVLTSPLPTGSFQLLGPSPSLPLAPFARPTPKAHSSPGCSISLPQGLTGAGGSHLWARTHHTMASPAARGRWLPYPHSRIPSIYLNQSQVLSRDCRLVGSLPGSPCQAPTLGCTLDSSRTTPHLQGSTQGPWQLTSAWPAPCPCP